MAPMKEFNPDDLAEFNGEGGKPVYIAHGGLVYDVTESRMWRTGLHVMRHHAGRDLTADIQAAPHGPEVLARYRSVAVFNTGQSAPRPVPPFVSRLLRHFPVLKRHPHPLTVHFPIVFLTSATIFTLLYLLTGINSFDSTALNCLGAGIIFTPAAMATGYYTWWLNYMARPMRPVIIKQRLSILMLCIAIVVFIWRIAVPDILVSWRPGGFIYLILVISLFPLVMVIGWFGATLTFPVEGE